MTEHGNRTLLCSRELHRRESVSGVSVENVENTDTDGLGTSMPYVEDLKPGQDYQLGEHTVTREEITRFAGAWDPQRFHLEDDQGPATPFDGLIASGWHTAAIFMKLYVETFLSDGGGTGSPGVDELRWPEPVRPGDTLTAAITIERIMPSLGYRDRANAILRCELTNQHGKTVMSMHLHNMFLRHPPGKSVS